MATIKISDLCLPLPASIGCQEECNRANLLLLNLTTSTFTATYIAIS